jgi:hypothetical protein
MLPSEIIDLVSSKGLHCHRSLIPWLGKDAKELCDGKLSCTVLNEKSMLVTAWLTQPYWRAGYRVSYLYQFIRVNLLVDSEGQNQKRYLSCIQFTFPSISCLDTLCYITFPYHQSLTNHYRCSCSRCSVVQVYIR